jgi:hypothetical protein
LDDAGAGYGCLVVDGVIAAAAHVHDHIASILILYSQHHR